MNTISRVVIVGALCAGVVVPVDTATAHNGVGAAFKGRAGHYTVYAYDGELLSDSRLDYKLVLLNARTKNPVYDTHPTVTASRSGEPAVTAEVTAFGNVFFYNLPNPHPHDWQVHLQITGSLGEGTVDFHMHGVTPTADPAKVVVNESGSSNWALFVGIAAAVMLAAFIIFRFLRHPSEPTTHAQED